MTYYLVRSKTAYFPLGEISFKKFYTDYGWRMLNRLIDKNQKEMLEKLTVRRSDGENITIEQFLDEIKELQLIEEK